MADEITKDEVLEEEEVDEVEDEVDEEETEAPVRKSASYYVGLRQGKKQAKKELEEKDSDDDEGDELTTPARNAIQKEFSRKLSPVMESLKKQADDAELRAYLAEHPSERKNEKAIRLRMDAWKDVPVEEIAKTVRKSEIDPVKKKEAVEKVRSTKLGGTSARGEEGNKLPSTPEEMQAIYKLVKSGKSYKMGELE